MTAAPLPDSEMSFVPPGLDREITFVDVAIQELATQIQHDNRSVAVVEHLLRDRFLGLRSSIDRLHVLPDPTRAQDVSWTLEWCRRLAQNGQRPILILTERHFQRFFGELREMLNAAPLPIRLIVTPDPESQDVLSGSAGALPSSPVLAFLRLLPGTKVVAPKDGWELRQMLRLPARGYDGPLAVQIPRGPVPTVRFPDFAEEIEIGKAEVLEEGNEVVLLALGSLVAPAAKAAEVLSKRGISAGVVNARFVEPLDRSLICELAGQVRGVVTLEEESCAGGFGTAVLELLADAGISTPVTVSGAVGLEGNGAGDEALVARIVAQVMTQIDRVNGTAAPAAESARKQRKGAKGAKRAICNGIDLFGFSTESLQREQDSVKARRLSPEVEDWFSVYSLVGERKRFLWQWCEQGAELTTLPCVPSELFAHVCQTKVLSIMLCVLLDDVADQRDRETFLEILLKVVDGQPLPDVSECSDDERHYAEITRRLAGIYFRRVRNYPCFATYEHLLRYDQFQYFNTMRYSQMLNRNLWLLNPIEHDLYLPHAMDMMSFATIDLMCTPQFPIEELGRLREALWHLQCMGRVGNLLSTWRREIRQQDYTSGVFARAVIEGDLSVEQLRPDNYSEIETAIVQGGHERYYFGRWKYHRECFLARSRHVQAIDLQKLLEGNDRFFLMHLGGRGLI